MRPDAKLFGRPYIFLAYYEKLARPERKNGLLTAQTLNVEGAQQRVKISASSTDSDRNQSSDGFRILLRTGNVRRTVGEGLARLESGFIVSVAGFADCVAPAIVPRNSGLAVDHCPGAVGTPSRFVRFAIALQRDDKTSSAAVANLPFTYKARWQ
jgi:hypothetical protein